MTLTLRGMNINAPLAMAYMRYIINIMSLNKLLLFRIVVMIYTKFGLLFA